MSTWLRVMISSTKEIMVLSQKSVIVILPEVYSSRSRRFSTCFRMISAYFCAEKNLIVSWITRRAPFGIWCTPERIARLYGPVAPVKTVIWQIGWVRIGWWTFALLSNPNSSMSRLFTHHMCRWYDSRCFSLTVVQWNLPNRTASDHQRISIVSKYIIFTKKNPTLEWRFARCSTGKAQRSREKYRPWTPSSGKICFWWTTTHCQDFW